MEIVLENIGKKFFNRWLFKGINLSFQTGSAYVLCGPNGSGKSTLLSIISGYQSPSAGKVIYQNEGTIYGYEQFYTGISFTAPYLELIEEYTLKELLHFHFSFKPIKTGESIESLIAFMSLEKASEKEIRYFSSGMKQRVKLGLALFTQSPVLLLDEPTVNLDKQGIAWYLSAVTSHISNRIVILASNIPEEYAFTDKIFNVTDYQ